MARYDEPGVRFDAGFHYDESVARERKRVMAKILRTLKKQPIPAKVDGVDQIAQAMTGNALATQLATELTDLQAKKAAAKTAYDAAQNGQAESIRLTAEQNTAESDLDDSFDTFADKAQVVTGGDLDKIRSLGLDGFVPGPGAAAGPMTKPENLSCTTGDFAGTVDAHWNKVMGAKSYLVQVCADPPTTNGWHLVGATPKSSYTAAGLTTGSTQWFRVAAVGVDGAAGPWSDPATVVVQ